MPDLLRLCTAGSVDDGKSTLIGRLLHDSRGVYEDQVRSVESASRGRGAGPIDYSLFTDGLKAEREQGITIDVAYRYFATGRRKFILADTPGHEQYTRNMATGASTADLAILLVDAQRGVRPQSRLHARIARLFGITEFVLAINKMDSVGFASSRFDTLVGEMRDVLDGAHTQAVPISALHGDNVTTRSERTPWYHGPPLLEYLETVRLAQRESPGPFRFPVQLVIRPNDAFRGYAGRILSGAIRVGDTVSAWPSGRTTRVSRIVTRGPDLACAASPMSVVLTLEDELDLSRGDALTVGEPTIASRLEAQVVWMDERALDPARMYLLKHTTRTVTAEVDQRLSLNEIGTALISTSRPLIHDQYGQNRRMGSFVLIDPETHFTAGAGMIGQSLERDPTQRARTGAAERLAALARAAGSDGAAADAIRLALEELLR